MYRYVTLALLLGVLCTPPATARAQEYDVYKFSQDGSPIPDVDKPDRDDDDIWPDAGDNSCWIAAAANVLGAAGYGIGGNAQSRAQGIYDQLVSDFGWANGGWNHKAINYWLHTYGKNPDRPEYRPDNPYTDVTVSPTFPLGLGDYNFLLDELARCQYVNVAFQVPAHAMTLVGGNYADPEHPGVPSTSVWHDSDNDRGGTDDDAYTNDFLGGATWGLIEYPAVEALRYVTLCRGLNKPEEAVRNYDVAWYLRDDDQDAVWEPGWRVAGAMGGVFDHPMWMGQTTAYIDNEFVEDMWKEVYLLVDYTDRVEDRDLLENVLLVDDRDEIWPATSVTASADDGQLLFYWRLESLGYQPEYEKILFPDGKYRQLDGNVKDWNLSTICVPEPCSVGLLALGAVLAFVRRRGRH